MPDVTTARTPLQREATEHELRRLFTRSVVSDGSDLSRFCVIAAAYELAVRNLVAAVSLHLDREGPLDEAELRRYMEAAAAEMIRDTAMFAVKEGRR